MSDNRSTRGTPVPSEAGGSRHTRPTPTAAITPPSTQDVDMDSDDDDDDKKRSRTKFYTAKPDMYSGDRNKMDDWIAQMKLYFIFNKVPNEQQSLFATTYLRGQAQHWIKPYLNSYLTGTRDATIKAMFKDFVSFETEVRKIFGISNELSTALRVIQNLTQKTSAADYAAKFKEYSQVTNWGDDALMVMYERGLKEQVKIELVRVRIGVTITTLERLITLSIEIDDRLYEHSMSKRRDFPVRQQTNSFRAHGSRPNNSKPYYHGDPMDLSVTTPIRQKGRGPKPGHKKNAGKLTCYACGKEGHMARDCRSKGQQGNVQPRQFNAAARKVQFNCITPALHTEAGQHDVQHWTACDDDACQVHMDAKQNSPRENGRGAYDTTGVPDYDPLRSPFAHTTYSVELAATQRQEDAPINQGYETSHTLGSSPGSSDQEMNNDSSEEEDSDDDESVLSVHGLDDGQEVLTFVVDAPKPMIEIINTIARASEEILPKIGGVRRLDAARFDRLLNDLRRTVWNWPQIKAEVHFSDFVVDKPPIGCVMLPTGGYVCIGGLEVTREMRKSIMFVKNRFRTIQIHQIQLSASGREQGKMEMEEDRRHKEALRLWDRLAPSGHPLPQETLQLPSQYQGKGKTPTTEAVAGSSTK